MNKEKNTEDIFIFRRMAEGDKEAFRFFFKKYYSDLCNFVNIYIHDPVMAEEIVQDIFIYFWEKKEIINLKSSVKSYLFGASKNKSLNYIRNEKLKLDVHEKLLQTEKNNYDMPDSIMETQQLQNIIQESMSRLPEKCREVYILGKEENLSYKEIAEKLGISIKTVENQMGKALKNLREQLRPYYKDIFIFFLIYLLH